MNPSQPPNVIYIFADQFRSASLGYRGEDPVRTPHLDRLASESVDFSRATSTYPLCSPYRGMLFTGKLPHRSGVLGNCNSTSAPFGCELDDARPCLLDEIANAGYETGYIGKWHLDAPDPGDAPFTAGYLHTGVMWDSYTPPGPDRHGIGFWHAYGCCDDHLTPHYFHNDAGPQDRLDIDDWSTAHETDTAIGFLKNTDGSLRNPNRPFWLFLSWNPPHPPYELVPQRLRDRFAGASPEKLLNRPNVDTAGRGNAAPGAVADYFAAVEGVDEQVGRLLDALDQTGLSENTIVVFTADHGEMMGSHGLMQKLVWYHESIDVPMMIRFPGRLQPRPEPLLIGTPDILPTLMGLAGIGGRATHDDRGEPLDGVDYSRHLLGPGGPGQPTPEEALYLTSSPRDPASGLRGLRTSRYTFAVGSHEPFGEGVRLYDDHEDPYQLINLAYDRPELARRLADRLTRRLRAAQDPWLRAHGSATEYLREAVPA